MEGLDDPTWEPPEHLVNCKKKLDEFRREKPTKLQTQTKLVIKRGKQMKKSKKMSKKDDKEEDNEVADKEDEQNSQADDEEEENQAAEVDPGIDDHEHYE
jgi:hypothetical protein